MLVGQLVFVGHFSSIFLKFQDRRIIIIIIFVFEILGLPTP